MKDAVHTGRVWVLASKEKRLVADIDTDQIFHNAHLHLTDIAQMGQYALSNLEGWKDFPQKARPGDILAAGRNFGAGSSRQQAVDCFLALKLGMIISPSFGAIYFRNAVNSGLPVLKCSSLERMVEKGQLESGDEVRVDLRTGEGMNLTKNSAFSAGPMSAVQYEIYRAGGLFLYGKSLRLE